MKKAVVIYSGGMDSFTVLHKAIREDYEVHALSFDYGQRHKKELDFAKAVCEQLQISHKIVDITAINQLLQGSSLTSDIAIPEGEYSVENMKSTVVPNRNMILLSLATGYAISLQAGAVFYGAHHDDSAVYPDCRPEFVHAVNDLNRIPIGDFGDFIHRMDKLRTTIRIHGGIIMVCTVEYRASMKGNSVTSGQGQ